MGEKMRLRALRAAAFTLVAGAAFGSSSGCAVSEADVRRWETTERGPEKLVAVMTHDKYSTQLRTDAALSLIHMKPRAGKRIGLDNLVAALAALDEASLTKIVVGMMPELVKEISAPPPPKNADGTIPVDPSVSSKDAAFAMLSHEPPLIKDDKSKADVQAALVQWSQTSFEERIENNAQAYGVEQMMRFLGAPAVKGLPQLINEQSSRVDRIATLIADLGDADTKTRGSAQLVALAKQIDAQSWVDRQKPLVIEANKKAGNNVTPEQLSKQIAAFQDQELTKIFAAMKRLGGRPVIEFCTAYVANPKNSEDRRKASIAALEGRIDKNNASDIDKIFAVAKDDATPDSIRQLAFDRLGELPKEQVVPKLYTLFENPKNWKIRWVAGTLVLKTMTTKGIPEFMKHLPPGSGAKMGMSEPINFGGLIQKMDAPKGEPAAKDAVAPFLASSEVGPRLVALGYYYNGKKADVATVKAHEGDLTPVPKCAPEDTCGWTCGIPKAPGSQETEDKEVKTVGDFAKYCVAPSMTN